MNPGLKKIIVIGVVVLVLASIGGFYFNNWLKQKMQKVELGLADKNFPYRDYTQDELNKMYPQIKYADVATRVTPEETYAQFRQALKENNLEMALEQLSKDSSRYAENVQDLTQAYKENRFDAVYQSYPEEITLENISEALSQFYFNYETDTVKKTHFINFIKNADGDWKLDSL